MMNAIKKVDAMLDRFWLGFVFAGFIRLKVKYHLMASDYYLNKLRSARRNSSLTVSASRQIRTHELHAVAAMKQIA